MARRRESTESVELATQQLFSEKVYDEVKSCGFAVEYRQPKAPVVSSLFGVHLEKSVLKLFVFRSKHGVGCGSAGLRSLPGVPECPYGFQWDEPDDGVRDST